MFGDLRPITEDVVVWLSSACISTKQGLSERPDKATGAEQKAEANRCILEHMLACTCMCSTSCEAQVNDLGDSFTRDNVSLARPDDGCGCDVCMDDVHPTSYHPFK